MFVIRHQFLGNGSIGQEKDGVNVQVENRFIVGELGDGRVGLIKNQTLLGRFFAAVEDGQQEDFGLGELFPDRFDHSRDPVRNFRGRIMPAVILADHHDREFWGNAVDVAVLQTPEGVLRAVSTDT